MSTNHTVVIIQNNHSNATEFLIIVSQTVFFVLLFLLMKSALIDRRGMMHSYDRIMEEKLQLGAIFFSIFVFLALLMIPMHSYEFIHFVVPLTYIIVFGIIIWEINIVYKKKDSKLPTRSTFNVPKKSPDIVKRDVIIDSESTPGVFLGTRSTTVSDTAFDY